MVKSSNLSKKDAIFIMSVGGGNLKEISVNLIKSVNFAKKIKNFWYSWKKMVIPLNTDVCIDIPNIDSKLITISEGFQAVIWHCLVSRNFAS